MGLVGLVGLVGKLSKITEQGSTTTWWHRLCARLVRHLSSARPPLLGLLHALSGRFLLDYVRSM
jgi:hypothetical protein